MAKNNIEEQKDKIILAILPTIINKCDHLSYSEIAVVCNDIAIAVLENKYNQESLFKNHLKGKSNEWYIFYKKELW